MNLHHEQPPPAPLLFGPATAAYLGMSKAQAQIVLVRMSQEPEFRVAMVVVGKGPRVLAAPVADVLRFLREHRSLPPLPDPPA